MEWELVPDPELPVLDFRVPPPSRPEREDRGTPTLPERGLKDRQEARRIGLHWRVRGRISADGRPESRESAARVAHLIEIASHLDGGNRFALGPAHSSFPRFQRDAVLSEAELVGLFPPPFLAAFKPPSVGSPDWAHLWLGRDLKGTCVGLPLVPGEGRHLLVLGETGMGKSSLLVQLAWQAARWGSVLLLDPIGDTARVFLAGLPDSKAPQVSWVSPSVPTLTMSLIGEVASGAGGSAAHRERLLGDVVAALRRVRAGRYAESTYWGPRLEEMLFHAIRAASRWPGASLSVAERLLTPEGFPGRNVPDSARDAVSDLRRRTERAPQDGDGARRLLSEITRSEVLREMLDADPATWSVREATAPGRTTVVSGDAPRVGESTARYLLAVVLALAWNAVLVRDRSTKIFLILDEAQWYAHDSVAEMLRLGRRFNLHVWAVTQSLASLPDVVRDAFMTNTADLVLFRGDPSDVRDVSRWVPHVTPERVLRMPRGEAAVLIDKGSETHWIRLSPLKRGIGDPDRFRPGPPTGDPLANGTGPSLLGSPAIGAPESPQSVPAGQNPFLEALRESLGRTDESPEITVRLSELRAKCSGEPVLAEQWIRRGGRFLAANGSIVRSGRDDRGAFWVLSRERLTSLLRSAPEVPQFGGHSLPALEGRSDPGHETAS
jgi:Helicase HerA, central domain